MRTSERNGFPSRERVSSRAGAKVYEERQIQNEGKREGDAKGDESESEQDERKERRDETKTRPKEKNARPQAPELANIAFLLPPFLLLIVITAPLSSAGGKNPSVCFIGSVAISAPFPPPGLRGMSDRLDEAGRRRLADRVGIRERGERGGWVWDSESGVRG